MRLVTVLAPVLVLSLLGCATSNRSGLYRTPHAWQQESSDPRTVMEEERPGVVRVTTTEDRFVLEHARLVGDSISGTAFREDGTAPQPGFGIAIAEVRKVEWWSGKGGPNALRELAVIAGTLAAALGLLILAFLFGLFPPIPPP